MSTLEEIRDGVLAAGHDNLLIAHATSTYPCPVDRLNLRMILTLKATHPECPIGYSSHETGLAPTWAAVTMGATFVERHVTLDRAMCGSDRTSATSSARWATG